ncbi:acyl-CoA-binding domain-containing protein 3-like [Rhodamnia argentea]|uniref:Acyl-CoA-binding domain-containing protein 3-like n=1 Tax=Rhodamnia argentea TaxID=178133 RepID=A0A8B8PB78_9MYRT|nr:acyl-CoA-binding domain-containing protein 3-like [Rhodamnia argentea]
MVLYLEFAFFVILATLLLLCVIVAKLRDMAESRFADQASTSSLRSQKGSSEEAVTSRSKRATAASTSQGRASKRRAVKLGGNKTGSDFDGSVGRKLESDDRTAREVEIIGSKESSIGTEVLRKEFDEIQRGSAEDDDWEGVERSESARLFGRAIQFACSARNAGLISAIHGEQAMKLYGLHKVALEGPCREHQPMAFRVSARAKWNAWQQLGNISPEVAMEEYIVLLSEKIPSWMHNNAVEDVVCTDAETFWKLICNVRTAIEQQTKTDPNRLQKLNPAT